LSQQRLAPLATNPTPVAIDRGTVMIRQGKGHKDRMVPIGARALAWIERYMHEVRPRLMVEPRETTLFLSHLGEPFTPNRLTQLVRDYIDAADIGKRGSCHLFRHTMATLMLENGADVRFIQAMLGHARLDTTQIYTQVSIRKLKEIHTATHPAKMQRHQAPPPEAPESPTLAPDATEPPTSQPGANGAEPPPEPGG
ncbi:MAG: tyrosine-type recombinase/integrase, partial [Phycisphaerae bacterium]